jgi:lysophospholipid acyltransferase (LPLAT)-like uncharacterized protein
MRRFVGLSFGFLVRAWLWTLRVKLYSPVELSTMPPSVFAFWHGRQMPLLAARRRRPSVAMVSRSVDGELQAGVLRALGVGSVRGSSSRGGAVGLAALIRRVTRRHEHALFAVDGPRGPAFRAKAGAAKAAVLSRAPLLPVGSRARWGFRLSRIWDDFLVVLPFSRVVIVVGAPLDAEAALADPRLIDSAIVAAGERAAHELALWGAP